MITMIILIVLALVFLIGAIIYSNYKKKSYNAKVRYRNRKSKQENK